MTHKTLTMPLSDKEIKAGLMDQFDPDAAAVYIKQYMFIKGFAIAKELGQTITALALARRLHEGQYRKGGEPYLCHPLKVCSTLISIGIDDDTTLAAALLHDTLEDCREKLPLKGRELVTEYHMSEDVYTIIELLSKESGLNDAELLEYFQHIEASPRAALIKLADRHHNSQTLYAFTLPKMLKYIRETDLFILPMASYCKSYYADYTNQFTILKTNIQSMNNAMGIMAHKIEKAYPDVFKTEKLPDKHADSQSKSAQKGA